MEWRPKYLDIYDRTRTEDHEPTDSDFDMFLATINELAHPENFLLWLYTSLLEFSMVTERALGCYLNLQSILISPNLGDILLPDLSFITRSDTLR